MFSKIISLFSLPLFFTLTCFCSEYKMVGNSMKTTTISTNAPNNPLLFNALHFLSEEAKLRENQNYFNLNYQTGDKVTNLSFFRGNNLLAGSKSYHIEDDVVKSTLRIYSKDFHFSLNRLKGSYNLRFNTYNSRWFGKGDEFTLNILFRTNSDDVLSHTTKKLFALKGNDSLVTEGNIIKQKKEGGITQTDCVQVNRIEGLQINFLM